jgi:hypothetical protein
MQSNRNLGCTDPQFFPKQRTGDEIKSQDEKTVQQDAQKKKKKNQKGEEGTKLGCLTLKRSSQKFHPQFLDLPYLSLHCFAHILH